MTGSADLAHVDTWIFDLDNTLYPPETEFMALIDGRITEFVMRETGLAYDEARVLQRRFLDDHGTTLAGMMGQYGIDPQHFLDEVHDVSHDRLVADPVLRAALARLPGRRLVFTNGSARHAERVLESLKLDDLFQDVFHLEAAPGKLCLADPDPRCDTAHVLLLRGQCPQSRPRSFARHDDRSGRAPRS